MCQINTFFYSTSDVIQVIWLSFLLVSSSVFLPSLHEYLRNKPLGHQSIFHLIFADNALVLHILNCIASCIVIIASICQDGGQRLHSVSALVLRPTAEFGRHHETAYSNLYRQVFHSSCGTGSA